jgi:hypothetical protein
MIDNEEEFHWYALACKQWNDEAMRQQLAGDRNAAWDARNLMAELRREMDRYDARVNPGRKGRWMPLYSGVRFWPEDPRAADVRLEDLAHSLARINRYNGHTKETFSVAQHLVLASQECEPEIALATLLHDAGEVYLGDVITPIKRLFRDFYETIEDRIMKAVARRFSFRLNKAVKKAVKRVDVQMLATEVRDLTTTGYVEQELTELPFEWVIGDCWSPERAEAEFFARFNEITEWKGNGRAA